MEGQRHNNPLTRVAFVYNGPKGMELAPNPHYSGGIAKALCELGGRVVRTLDLRSVGREFESQPLRYRVQPWASC